ncbi:N4-gp56 family major capsid protein [Dokdonella sp.]|uniref:N4-gp56 family major capsid protein n=1 Tax=Dokdonella sp. TaxID=2291710 RepID=UPI002DD648EB|nr:N4-gp56 family major capsid protein [Dokdonella sp.]
MSVYSYGNPAGRINKLKGEILSHSIPVETLGITGMQRQIPANKGKTVVYRRYLPYGGSLTNFNTINRWNVDSAAHVLAEGVTPTADSLIPQDITVTLNQYGCLYQVTDQTVDTYEDDVPAEMKKQCGERVGLIREMVRYGVIKSGANAYYSGGSSRGTVAAKLTLTMLRKASRNTQANHAKRITSILAPTPNIGTKPVEAAYLVFCHTDVEQDIRDIAGFTPIAAYGSRKPMHDQEIGSVENFRFITSPELNPYANAGVAVGATGLYSTGGSNVDVYPVIVCGEDAWGQVALRGGDSLDPTWIPPGEKTKSDPLGQRGFVGAKFYMNCTVLNDGWMAIIEAGITAL